MRKLHLNLFRGWFDMMYKLLKTEEYRAVTSHWCSMFLLFDGGVESRTWWDFYLIERDAQDILSKIGGQITFRNYDSIIFSNGYAKDRPQFEIELKSIKIAEGKPEWGAEDGVKYFVLELGEIKEEPKIWSKNAKLRG